MGGPFRVDRAAAGDAGDLARLLGAYMRETFRVPWAGTTETLLASMRSGDVTLLIARRDREAVGFAALVDDFDLHHCVRGVRVVDLYAAPEARNAAAGVVLLAHVAADVIARERLYLRGEAVDRRATRRLFARFAVRFGDTYNVSDPELSQLAAMRGMSAREMAREMARRVGIRR